MAGSAKQQPAAVTPPRDLGFGTVVASQSRKRLLNSDGSFNVVRRGLGWRASLSLFNDLVTMSWPRFVALVAGVYLAVNWLFALGYLALGPAALNAGSSPFVLEQLSDAFFFSVQTFSTVGYGHLYPVSTGANLLMTVESIVSLLMVALVTGLAFARFSRPMAKIRFSRHAVIGPYRGGKAFKFRIANQRKTQIIELAAQVMFTQLENVGGDRVRRFHELALERKRVMFFPLSWTIVHAIDETSPFHEMTSEDSLESEVEILVLLTGTDETFSQIVHTRSSYRAEEIAWDAEFGDIFERPIGKGPLAIDIGRLHDIRQVEVGEQKAD